ncbi:hypothetical protein ACIRCZ_07520 [Leifsonia sp. NPDC102414]|uniref:hypothetical protein n=1 Tax=Leifsonia sp. NPDC102414 TaxID=3364124 RepID=UPI0037F6A6E1
MTRNVLVFTPFCPVTVTAVVPTSLFGSSTVDTWKGIGSSTVTVFVSISTVGVGVDDVGAALASAADVTGAACGACGAAAFAIAVVPTTRTNAEPATIHVVLARIQAGF